MFVGLALAMAAVDGRAIDNRDTCEILATVAKEHFGLDEMSGPPLVEIGSGYVPRCDWVSFGMGSALAGNQGKPKTALKNLGIRTISAATPGLCAARQ